MLDYVLLAAFILGLVAGGFLMARYPAFWVGLAMVTLQRAWPYLVKLFAYLKLPLSPEDQKKLDQSRRRAEEWDPFRKKPRDR
jgi:hypothetical protein